MSLSRNIYRKRGTGSVTRDGYLLLGKSGKQTPEHVLIAEKVLGRALSTNEVVHHIDGNGLNNAPQNLVICPTQSYHMILHRRQEAFGACGNAGHRKCIGCHTYDDPEKMKSYTYKVRKFTYFWHKGCRGKH